MLKTLRIQSFKGWKDTGEIKFSPITLFFGANSSGKSSIGQFLMMLKQTTESSDRKSVFFFGSNNSHVQLGSYQDVIFQHDLNNDIQFSYSWELPNKLEIRDVLKKSESLDGNIIHFSATINASEKLNNSLGIGVGTAQLLQHLVVIGLDAQRDTVEAFGTEPVQQPVVDGVGIALEGDLGVVVHVEIPADGGEDHGHAVSTEKAGGTAAEIDGVHLVVGGQGAGLLDMGADGVQIAVDELVMLFGDGIEVAVLALAAAERHVNIDAQRSLVGTLCKNWHKSNLTS